MNKEYEALLCEFESWEKARGIKALKRIRPHVKPFFTFLDLKGLSVAEVGFKEAQEFQTYLTTLEDAKGRPRYATLSVKSIVSMTTRLFSFLKQTKKTPGNPFRMIRRIKTERKLPRNIPVESVMNAILEELGRFWEAPGAREARMRYRAHVMAELMYATGLRIGEVLRLNVEDVDFVARTILVRSGKGDKDRIAYLNDYAARVLHLYVKEMRDVINMNKDAGELFGIVNMATVGTVFHKRLGKIATAHGIKRFTSHTFRHSLGFHLLRRGCDMRFIQIILGHEDMNTTTIYTHVDKGDLKRELDVHHPRHFVKAAG